MCHLKFLSIALCLISVFLIGCNSVENQNGELTSNPNVPVTTGSPTPQSTPSDGAKRITLDELRAAWEKDSSKIVIVDVRDKSSYEANHIKGAINIPVTEVSQRAKEVPRDKMIVTYCS